MAAVAVLDAEAHSSEITVFPSGTGAAGNEYRTTYTVSAGSNRCLVALVQWGNAANMVIQAITWGGVNLRVAGAPAVNSIHGSAIFVMLEADIAAAGSTTFSVTFTDVPDRCIVSLSSYSNVASIAAYTTASGATGTSATVTPTGATANDYSIGAAMCSSTLTVTAGTSLYNTSGGKFYAGIRRSGATSTLTVTFGSGESYALAAILMVAVTALIQEGYRFRNDDGSETTATWNVAQDTNTTLTSGSLRLRVIVDTDGETTSKSYQLEYRKSGETIWHQVTKQ